MDKDDTLIANALCFMCVCVCVWWWWGAAGLSLTVHQESGNFYIPEIAPIGFQLFLLH